MRAQHHFRTWVRLIALVVGLAATAAPTQACQGINAGDYIRWYTTSVTSDSGRLPSDLHMTIEWEWITLSNSGPTAAFVLGHGAGGAQPEVPLTLPAGFTATHKLADNTAADWFDGRWAPGANAARIDLTALFPPLGMINPVNSARPLQAAPPAPQSSRLVVLYGESLLTVPVTVTYALDPDYDVVGYQQAERQPCGFGASYSEGLLQLVMMACAVFVIVAGPYILVMVFSKAIGLYQRRGSR
jgi:hypothetical protein